MKLRNNKKGFTIVELVIVIAVIGILTAILVPVFINLTNKANEASDQSLVKNLNTALKMVENDPSAEDEDTHQKLSGKNNTMQDVVLDLKYEGYYLENLVAKSGQDLLWDASKNEFFLSTESTQANVDYWQIVKEVPATASQKYSYYAGKNFNTTVPNLKYGFDAGDVKGITSLNYVGPGANPGQTAAIRTNSSGTNLTINAANDTVNHYGHAGSIDIIAVANKSYHENGKIAFLEIAKGRVALESGSDVKQIHVSTKIIDVAEDGTKTKEANTFDQVIIALASGVETPDFSRDEVALSSVGAEGKLVVEIEKENNQSDYVYLYQQGLVEQIRVASGDSTKTGDSVQPAAITEEAKKGSDESLSSNTSSIAIDIANNLKAGSTATPEQIAAGTVDVEQIEEAGLTEEAKETAKETAVNDAMVEEYSESGDKAIPENAVAYNVNTQTYYAIDDDHATGMAALRAALDGADSKDVILLMNDVTLTLGATNARFPISKSVTLNGNGHTVTTNGRGFGVGADATSKVDVTFKNITITNAQASGRCIDTRGNLASLTLDSVTLKTTSSSGYVQPLTIGGNQSDVVPVTIKNSTIQTSDDGRYGYAIITFNPVNMKISDSEIKGWACIYAKGPDGSAGSDGSSYSIDNTHLVSKNVYAGDTNAFCAIKMEDNDIINFILRDCTLDIISASNWQGIVAFRDLEQNPVSGCALSILPGNTVNFDGDYAYFVNGTENGSILYITGGTFNKNPTDHLVEGYVAQDNGDGTWTVVPAAE